MVRLARFSADAFVEATLALVAEGGPSAASMAAIARKVGAPTGSIYHRFESRSAILATAWLECHESFAQAVAPPLLEGQGLEAALSVAGWARLQRRRARFLLLNEIETLLEDPVPEPLQRRVQQQQATLDAAFDRYLEGRSPMKPPEPSKGSPSEAAARAKFLIFDGPIALLRPHLLADVNPPLFLDEMITDMHRSLGSDRTPDERAPDDRALETSDGRRVA
jgi:AcrR family transcriptional regulator